VRFVAAIAVQTLVLGAAYVAVIGAGVGSVPGAPAALARPLPEDTLVYDRTGQVLLADLHPSGYQHYQRSLADMGRYLPAATVAIEDRAFWNEPGVDPLAIARAAGADLRSRAIVEGGSTITQQLVKQRFIGDDRTFSRKFTEAAIAVTVTREFSRRQILELYLNDVFYGNTAYGAEAAAQIYFRRPAADLDLAQAALIAGLPQAPTQLDPLRHWSAARARQLRVLDAMVESGAITEADAESAAAEDLSPPEHIFAPQPVNVLPAFQRYVSRELPQRVGAAALARGGLRVLTTLDWDLQRIGQDAVSGIVQASAARDMSDGALAAVDPRSGQILAFVSSAGPGVPGAQFDMVTSTPRNPGSSFKIFTYTAAIASGQYTMVTHVQDGQLVVPMPGGEPYAPRNFDGRDHGECQLEICLASSLNVPAVRIELALGIPTVVEQARRMGAPPYQLHGDRYTTDDPPSTFGPSLTLGGYGETPLQMATGASTLADQGVRHDPQAILSVQGPEGGLLYAAGAQGQRVVDERTSFIVGQMLSDPVNRNIVFGPNTPLALPGRHAAAKTGTAEDFKDAWTVGYTPSLAAAIWLGNTDGHPMVIGTDGIDVAAVAWHNFMVGALDHLGRGDEWYSEPPGLEVRQVETRTAYFFSGTAPPA
jgi:membrane peptidoglycan carboxypeptidase